MRRALEEERHWNLQDVRDVLRRLALMRLVPFSYFCTCWNVIFSASPSFSWLMPSIFRAHPQSAAMCLSIGLGSFLAMVYPERES
jgi:hypothetical protein